jgi:hypothetical protein
MVNNRTGKRVELKPYRVGSECDSRGVYAEPGYNQMSQDDVWEFGRGALGICVSNNRNLSFEDRFNRPMKYGTDSQTDDYYINYQDKKNIYIFYNQFHKNSDIRLTDVGTITIY